MKHTFLYSLKFQLGISLFVILSLFGAATLFTFYALEQHKNDSVILNLAHKLQITATHISTQAMHYKENAPRDYTTYFRDIKLYYQDLMAHTKIVKQITDAFMSGRFPPELTNLPKTVFPLTDQNTSKAVKMLEDTWVKYYDGLMERIGDNPEEPRLEYAAIYIEDNQEMLDSATNEMLLTVQTLVNDHINRTNQINWLLLAVSSLIIILIILWFYFQALKPLQTAARGFKRVSQGEFGFQIPPGGSNELSQMTMSFNSLSKRLNAVFSLLDQLQRGSDVDSTLSFVWHEFRTLLPLEWIGVLLPGSDQDTLMLVSTYSDTAKNTENKKRFKFDDPLIMKILRSDLPVNMNFHANSDNESFSLQSYLTTDLNLKSALLMPLKETEMNLHGILIFANTSKNAFQQENVEFLKNISHLVTTSFSKTLQLMDNTRLAAIGGFASSIAHEIRTPLTTITMAIEHFQKADLPENSLKRAHLASEEVHRVTRLLEDMLLYAKPVKLNMQEVNTVTFMQNFIQTHKHLITKKQQTFELIYKTDESTLYCDPDRLIQVMLNLTSNASDAAPEGSKLSFIIEASQKTKQTSITLHNEGEPIKVETMSRLTEPFFTTRSGGTGLGLAIVKRIIEMHGGHLSILSSDHEGTRFTATFSAA